MTMSIVNHQIPDATHDLYNVTFFDDTILTLVTATPSCVDAWIADLERIYRHRLRFLTVGLDVEWRPNRSRNYENPVATLQLCVGRHCLIFQLLFSPAIPLWLRNFLRNPSCNFAGVRVDKDAEKLMKNWNLEVGDTADIGGLAAEEYGMKDIRNVGLIELTRKILRKELINPEAVKMSQMG